MQLYQSPSPHAGPLAFWGSRRRNDHFHLETKPLTDGDAEVRASKIGGAVELPRMMVPLVLLKRPRQIKTPPR
jgi:hypothetical protein